jgi:high affinity Mn2+ porin
LESKKEAGMRWPLLFFLLALALCRLVGASRADPPAAVLPPEFPPQRALLGPVQQEPPSSPTPKAVTEKPQATTPYSSDCHWGQADDDAIVDGHPSLLGFLFGFSPRYRWHEPGRHPRMFGVPGIPVPEEEASKPKGPTTFPQALHQYFRCLRSHGQTLKEDDKKEKSNGQDDRQKMNGKKDEKGTPKEGGEGNQQTAFQEDLGAERAGRSIGFTGETGILGKGTEATWYSAHAQGTVVDSVHDVFHAPYTGPNSLLRSEPHATSETTTFFFAARLCEGFEFVFNPEVAGGRGFSGSDGIAGFPNGEITRVGVVEPTPYFARLFFRQTIGFGGEKETVEDGVNQIAGTRDVNRLTIAAGRFSMTDVADDNRFSHDPRTQFLAWSIMYNGAWDYPANVRGYTDAIAIDFNQKYWALHYGIGAVAAVANGAALDPRFLDANGQVLEWLGRYKLFGDRPGNLRLLAYLNRAHMGDYAEALALMPVNPQVTLTRAYRYKYGFGLSWDQELTKNVGVFGRLGWNDGHTEAWMFTPIDRLAELGLWIRGRPWCRPHDQFGLAYCINGLARDHREYLAAGGLDFNIGDGKLNYGQEMILESVYNLGVTKNILFSLDFQEVWNPAYNRDRGPVTIFQGRFHIEF